MLHFCFSFDETTDLANKIQLATIILFVNSEGNYKERYLSFTDVSNDKIVERLLKHVIKTIGESNCSKKFEHKLLTEYPGHT